MSNLVKIIIFVAFAIFAIGFIWAIVVAVKKPNQVVKNNEQPKTEQTTLPAPAPVAPATPAPAPTVQPNPPVAQPAKSVPKKKVRQYVTTTTWYEASVTSTGGNAWASAGVDANGNAYANAHAH